MAALRPDAPDDVHEPFTRRNATTGRAAKRGYDLLREYVTRWHDDHGHTLDDLTSSGPAADIVSDLMSYLDDRGVDPYSALDLGTHHYEAEHDAGSAA